MDFLNKLGIILSELKDTSAHLLDEHLNACLSNGVIVSLGKLPGSLEHADEILIIGDAHREICVVIEELLESDLAVTVALRALKVLQELVEDLIFSLFHLDKLWVHRNVVDLNDIHEVDEAAAIPIKVVEDFLHHLCAAWCHLIAKAS